MVFFCSSGLPLSPAAGSQDRGLERQTVWAGQCLDGRGSAWASLGALHASLASHRKLLTLPHHVSFYDPISTLELRSWLQLLLHAAFRQCQAFPPPLFCPHSDPCLECFSSLAWSAPQPSSVQFLSYLLHDTSKCLLGSQALPSAP